MPEKRTIRVLSAEDIKKALTMAQATEAMKTAFLQLSLAAGQTAGSPVSTESNWAEAET